MALGPVVLDAQVPLAFLEHVMDGLFGQALFRDAIIGPIATLCICLLQTIDKDV